VLVRGQYTTIVLYVDKDLYTKIVFPMLSLLSMIVYRDPNTTDAS